MTAIEIGRLLRSATTGCVVGCQTNRSPLPAFGELVKVPINPGETIFGLIVDIHIDDDGLVRQLATAANITEEIIQDNRLNRNVPVELSVLFMGYEQEHKIFHLLPPHPPLSLEKIYTCSENEISRFTSLQKNGYLRHIIARFQEFPAADLLAAHLKQASIAHQHAGDPQWINRTIQEVITLLRDDYPSLTNVLGALADADLVVNPEQV
jgi:hypothetical protein